MNEIGFQKFQVHVFVFLLFWQDSIWLSATEQAGLFLRDQMAYGKKAVFLGADHYINKRHAVKQMLSVLLRDTTGHGYDHLRPFGLHSFEPAKKAVCFLFGLFADATGIDHNQIRGG